MIPKTTILTTPKADVLLVPEQHALESAIALISKQVMHALGKPANLLTVQIRPLWENWYRANVFIGRDVTAASIAHSYFLKVDRDGNIVESKPKITKQY
jgi:hypothetical protein